MVRLDWLELTLTNLNGVMCWAVTWVRVNLVYVLWLREILGEFLVSDLFPFITCGY